MIRVTVHYSGTVQGVGFRYTVVRLAQRLKVSGRVKNLDDGRVRLVVEGETEPVERLLEDIRDHMAGLIDDEQLQRSAPTGELGPPAVGGVRIEY